MGLWYYFVMNDSVWTFPFWLAGGAVAGVWWYFGMKRRFNRPRPRN